MNKKIKHILILLGIILFAEQGFSQNRKADSIRNVLKIEKDDTNKVYSLNKLIDYLYEAGKYDTAMLCAKSSYRLAERLNFRKGKEVAYGKMGIIYYDESNYPKAIEYDSKALTMAQELGDKNDISTNLCNLGLTYSSQGNYPKALEYNLKALAIAQEIKSKQLIGSDLSNIGLIFVEQGNYSLALEYYSKALAIAQEIGYKSTIVNDLGNIGLIYQNQGNYPKALEYDAKALAMAQEIGDKTYIANILDNLAGVYTAQGNYPKALEYDTKALLITEEIGDKTDIGSILGSIGDIYQKQGNYSKALEHDTKALAIARQIGDKNNTSIFLGKVGGIYILQKKYLKAKTYLDSSLTMSQTIGGKENIKDVYNDISNLDSATGNFKASFEDYKKYIIYRDSLLIEANNQAVLQAQMNDNFKRQTDSAKAAQDKQNVITEKETQRQKVIRNALTAGFILMIVLAFIIFRGYRQKQKANVMITHQKEEVEKQKEEVEKQKNMAEDQKKLVEEKNKDILDSITYAKRLQDAILPPLSLIRQYLPHSFLVYKPKDIVAGDFYWMERANETIFIAAADCTGHGVSGALVSVVCSNALNRAVKEFHVTEPGKILDKVRELVLETFGKSESNVQDGMSIALCSINTKTLETKYSGAYNSLWYIQNNEMHEATADKQPIGKFNKPLSFTTHSLLLQKGNTLYLLTDGYSDQLGGPQNKKFDDKNLKGLLLENSFKPMDEQKAILESTLEKWKEGIEQADDILVIGIRI